MSWTAPRTWVVGEVVTKALLDAQIRDNELVLHDPVMSMIPMPIEPITGASTAVALAANDTTAHLGVVYVPRPITVTGLRYNIGAGGAAASAVRFALYAEDGQTRLINVSEVCGANTGVRLIDVDPDVALDAGNYILLVCHSVYATSAKTITRFTYDSTFEAHIANEPDLSGTLTITGGAAPATIDIDAFTTVAAALIPEVRLMGSA